MSNIKCVHVPFVATHDIYTCTLIPCNIAMTEPLDEQLHMLESEQESNNHSIMLVIIKVTVQNV